MSAAEQTRSASATPNMLTISDIRPRRKKKFEISLVDAKLTLGLSSHGPPSREIGLREASEFDSLAANYLADQVVVDRPRRARSPASRRRWNPAQPSYFFGAAFFAAFLSALAFFCSGFRVA